MSAFVCQLCIDSPGWNEMADITIKCAQCGREITLSEHVTMNMLPCNKCGELIPIPGRQSTSNNLRVKTEDAPVPAGSPGQGENAEPGVVAKPAEGVRLKNRQKRATVSAAIIQPGRGVARGGISPVQIKGRTARARMAREHRRQNMTTLTLVGSWAMFLLLGSGLAYFRFVYAPVNIAPALFADIRNFAVLAIVICYIITVLMALKDDVFQGLLSLAIPMYPFYYLFAESATVFFRSAVAALLAGFGYDFCISMRDVAVHVFDFVNRWIQPD